MNNGCHFSAILMARPGSNIWIHGLEIMKSHISDLVRSSVKKIQCRRNLPLRVAYQLPTDPAVSIPLRPPRISASRIQSTGPKPHAHHPRVAREIKRQTAGGPDPDDDRAPGNHAFILRASACQGGDLYEPGLRGQDSIASPKSERANGPI